MQTLEILIFLVKTGMKFQNLQISESLNINPNKFSRLRFQPFKIMHIS